MGDLAQFFARQVMYKRKGDNFGSPRTMIAGRVEKMNHHRRDTRRDMATTRRHIPENMTPWKSPPSNKIPELPNDPPVNTSVVTTAPMSRLEMLHKWKKIRDKVREMEKQKAKPIFKVTHVPNPVTSDLENVNFQIKGKPFKSKFAPDGHKFKAPDNIKPIAFQVGEKQQKPKKNVPSATRTMVTRSQAKKLESGVQKTKLPMPPAVAVKTTPEAKVKSPSSEAEKTPNASEDSKPQVFYTSPYVTVARGKDNARKEYHSRSPSAGALYFQRRLEDESCRLKKLCQEWNDYKKSENVPEEAVSMIDVATGQTNLLLTKKFMQFQGLIDKCLRQSTEETVGELLVTCADLHGFWDMINMQITNVDKRFDNLVQLRSNNWEEILPEKKEPEKAKKRTKKTARIQNVKPSADLMALIAAKRRNKSDISEEKTSGTAAPSTPKRSSVIKKLQISESQKMSSGSPGSPGLIMLRVSQYGKTDTPGKGILKAGTLTKSNSKKSVLFKQPSLDSSPEDVENNQNLQNSKTKKPHSTTKSAKTPTRRSARLERTKLFASSAADN